TVRGAQPLLPAGDGGLQPSDLALQRAFLVAQLLRALLDGLHLAGELLCSGLQLLSPTLDICQRVGSFREFLAEVFQLLGVLAHSFLAALHLGLGISEPLAGRLLTGEQPHHALTPVRDRAALGAVLIRCLPGRVLSLGAALPDALELFLSDLAGLVEPLLFGICPLSSLQQVSRIGPQPGSLFAGLSAVSRDA